MDVYGIGVGTMKKSDMNDLEYFKDPHFRGWDARHNAEAERTLLRVLASRVRNLQPGTHDPKSNPEFTILYPTPYTLYPIPYTQ